MGVMVKNKVARFLWTTVYVTGPMADPCMILAVMSCGKDLTPL